MALNLVDHVGGIVHMADDVEIVLLERDGERFWCVRCSPFAPSENPPEMVFREPSVPRIVRQLYAVLKWRGAEMQRSADSDHYAVLGPRLLPRATDPDRLYCIGEYGGWYGAFSAETPQPTDPATLRSVFWRPEFAWIFETLENEINRPIARGDPREKALRWRLAAAAAPRRRALARTEALREELIAAAWHPRHMIAWCLDEDERHELAEMGAR